MDFNQESMEELLLAIRNLVKECRANNINIKGIIVDEPSKKIIEDYIPDTGTKIVSGNESYISLEIMSED